MKEYYIGHISYDVATVLFETLFQYFLSLLKKSHLKINHEVIFLCKQFILLSICIIKYPKIIEEYLKNNLKIKFYD